MDMVLKYRGRVIRESDLAVVRALIEEHPAASRRKLSRELCAVWNWVQPNGAACDMICRGLMLALERAGHIALPPVRQRPPNPLAVRQRPLCPEIDATPITSSLADLGPLAIRLVRRTPEEALFNGLIEQHHYLRYTQPVGEQVKYMVFAGNRPVACLAWSSAARHLGPRDRFIGWNPEARRRNIRFIAYNSRYLVLPWVQIKCLASHILGRVAARISADWERIYGHPVYYLETFIDPQRWKGTCYRAANWIVLGLTTGCGKDATSKRPNRPLKQVLAYPLDKRFRRLLAEW
jgi:hypothetical protein